MIFGVWPTLKPLAGPIPLPSTFVNPNHAAAAFAIVPPLVLGIGLKSESSLVRLTAVMGAALAGACTIMTLSRGGMAVLAAEIVAMGALALQMRDDAGRRRSAGLATAAVAAAGAVSLAIFVALEPAAREATDTSTGKLALIGRAARMSLDFLVTGVGRGAFTSTFPAYEGDLHGAIDVAGRVRFTHAESWPIQLVLDVGAPVAAAFLVLVVVGVAPGARLALRRPTLAGALVALLGLGAHDLADFALDFAGVALLGAGLLALVVSGERPTGSPRVSPSATFAIRAVIAAGAIAGFAAHWRHDVDDDAAHLADRWQRSELAAADNEIRAAMQRHPAEPYFFLVAAARDFSGPQAGPLLARAVTLGPWRAQSHYWLARWFESKGRRGQAWAEYREAVRLNPALSAWALADLIRQGSSVYELESVQASEGQFEDASVALERSGRKVDSVQLDDWMIDQFRVAARARFRRVLRLRDTGLFDEANRESQAFLKVAPNEHNAYLAAAALEKDTLRAEGWLVRGTEVLPNNPELLSALIRRRGARLGLESLAPELERLRAALASRQESPVVVDELMGDVERERGHLARAMSHYLDAASSAGDGAAGYYEKAARAAEDLPDLALAEKYWRRVAIDRPGQAWILERADRAAAARKQSLSHVPGGAQPAQAP
jgi:tetratricopeptide (TPR) repeat protein